MRLDPRCLKQTKKDRKPQSGEDTTTLSETFNKLRDQNKIRTFHKFETDETKKKDRKRQPGEDTATMSETTSKLRDRNKVRTYHQYESLTPKRKIGNCSQVRIPQQCQRLAANSETGAK